MTRREKIDRAVADLVSRKVARLSAAPPLYRFLWRLGLLVAPPHFQCFLVNLLISSLVLALSFLVTLLPLVSLGVPRDVWTEIARFVAVACLGGGVIAGLIIAGYFRLTAWRLGLPRWADYVPPARPEDEPEPDW